VHVQSNGEEGEGLSGSTGEGSSSPGKGSLGVLRGHIARANPQCKVIIEPSSHLPSASDTDGDTPDSGPSELKDEVLILFQSPAHSYVSPRYYRSTKPSTGKVVPTWNYSAVQVYGKCHIYNTGPSVSPFLQKQVEDLTNFNEPLSGGGWKVSDAPSGYLEIMRRGIVGIEVEITRIEGRYKMSQEKDQGDWEGVLEGFKAMGTELGDEMARRVVEERRKRDAKADA